MKSPDTPHTLFRPDRRRMMVQIGGLVAGLITAPALGGAGQGKRIVSIGGALTEIVYALGGQATLAGVDSTSLFPESATRLPNVGYARSLSAEGILALAPTHIIVTEDAGPPAVMRQLAQAGIPLSVHPGNHRFEGLLERVSSVGSVIDRQPQAAELVASLGARWQVAQQQIVAFSQRPKVLFVLSHTQTQIMVSGSASSADAMLTYAGASNAVKGFSGFKPLTPEAVIAAAPDVVLFTRQGLEAIGGIEGALRLPGIAQTPAGRARRIISHEAMFLLGFGPRLPDALIALHASIRGALQT
ncbi:ABC transporter substrate-binding protein [Burkholderiaceae bacterium DAT-1]|nr:ABC transporter substrate-binding protein [Burkholderiaceae bacterium DAT-1]